MVDEYAEGSSAGVFNEVEELEKPKGRPARHPRPRPSKKPKKKKKTGGLDHDDADDWFTS